MWLVVGLLLYTPPPKSIAVVGVAKEDLLDDYKSPLLIIHHQPSRQFHTTGKSNIICGHAALIPEVVAVLEAADAKMWKKARREESVCLRVCVCLRGVFTLRQPSRSPTPNFPTPSTPLNTHVTTTKTHTGLHGPGTGVGRDRRHDVRRLRRLPLCRGAETHLAIRAVVRQRHMG